MSCHRLRQGFKGLTDKVKVVVLVLEAPASDPPQTRAGCTLDFLLDPRAGALLYLAELEFPEAHSLPADEQRHNECLSLYKTTHARMLMSCVRVCV